MARAEDIIIEDWADLVVKLARKNAAGTKMARTLTVKVRNGLILWEVVNYGAFQNTGVKGSVRTIAKVGKAQKEAIRMGVATREYAYKDKQPPNENSTPPTKLSWKGANTIFITGFPSKTPKHFRWLNKAFLQANKQFEKRVTDELINIWTEKIYGN